VSDYKVIGIDEIPARDNWIPIRDQFGIGAFGVNAYRGAEAGSSVISDHTELMARHEELYVVVEGHATFTVDGEEVDAPIGTLVFVSDPATRRAAVAKEPGTTVLVAGAKPGDRVQPRLLREHGRKRRCNGRRAPRPCDRAVPRVPRLRARGLRLRAGQGRSGDPRTDGAAEMTYRTAQLDDVEVASDGRCPMRPVRHHLGITSFGVNSWTGVNAGDRIVNEHDEQGEDEELYVVLDGHARFEIDGEAVDAPRGTLVFVRPGVKRTAFAEEAGTTIVVVGGTPGEAYVPTGWEVWMPLNSLYAEGRYEEAADRGLEVIEANPQYGAPLYNLACCESLAGRTDEAIEHLRAAIDISERGRQFARGDSDFDPIREDPRFVELVGT